MHTRRATLGVLAGTCATALAGCSFLDDALEQSADPAAVEPSVVDSTSFQHDSLTEQSFEETVEVGGESRDVKLTNWTNRYTTSVSGSDIEAARFSLFTTPTVSVAGESANPFGRLDREQLLRAMVERVDTGPIERIERAGERTLSVLGGSVTVGEFEAETEQTGVRLRLHLGDRAHDGDLLVFLGVHPELLDLSGDIDTLAESTVHPAERP
jgi:hypothetical protein